MKDEALAEVGVRVMRLGMMSPVEPEAVRRFAAGLEEIVVIEDKTSFMETQIRDLLYGTENAPRILGKKDATGQPARAGRRRVSPRAACWRRCATPWRTG
ncbi:hypothetical protein [Nocardioides convexus]|uniref:hypothetical protein n=1 Tax=Nocardioides convexus TaxID=2712224 RepID=UPI0024184095|nr:hypothetical protein [Nocardioides convexus]